MEVPPPQTKISTAEQNLSQTTGIFICWGFYNKLTQTGWLEQKKFIFLQCWRLVSSCGLFQDLPPWLIDNCPLTASFTWVPFCVSPRVPVSSSHKDTCKSHWIRAHSNGLILIPLHFEVLACRALMHQFGADIIQPISTRTALTSGTRQFRPLKWF